MNAVFIALLTFIGSQGAVALYNSIFSRKQKAREEIQGEMDIFRIRIDALKEINEELRTELKSLQEEVRALRAENLRLFQALMERKQ